MDDRRNIKTQVELAPEVVVRKRVSTRGLTTVLLILLAAMGVGTYALFDNDESGAAAARLGAGDAALQLANGATATAIEGMDDVYRIDNLPAAMQENLTKALVGVQGVVVDPATDTKPARFVEVTPPGVALYRPVASIPVNNALNYTVGLVVNQNLPAQVADPVEVQAASASVVVQAEAPAEVVVAPVQAVPVASGPALEPIHVVIMVDQVASREIVEALQIQPAAVNVGIVKPVVGYVVDQQTGEMVPAFFDADSVTAQSAG
jgi:hypothetical protein